MTPPLPGMTAQTTTVSAEGGANPRHPTTRRSDDHVELDDDVELRDLARKASVGDAIVVKPTSNVGAASEATVVQTKAQRLRARIQFATLCWTLYLSGWNDGTTGPLLPRIRKVYNVSVPLRGWDWKLI